MSVLRTLEDKLATIVEGTFSRAFKSAVTPVELARKLAREMDEHRTQSLQRVYVPNEYVVWLGPKDRARFADREPELAAELEAYLLEHARREQLHLVARPQVSFSTDERLALGTFGIQARTVRPSGPERGGGGEQGDHGRTTVHSVAERVQEQQAAPRGGGPRQVVAVLVLQGRRRVLEDAAVLGRSRDVDVHVDDPGISRRHCEVRPSGGGWVVRDLGSTNGTRLNGRALDERGQSLRPGDVIELGETRVTFETEQR